MMWIITLDHLDDHYHGFGDHGDLVRRWKALGSEARRVAVNEFIERNAAELPHEFQLLDDDGEVYYTGRCGNLNDADGDSAFAPLDWATPRFGCTEMRFRLAGTADAWETL